MPQAHCFKLMELALTAQAGAVRLACPAPGQVCPRQLLFSEIDRALAVEVQA